MTAKQVLDREFLEMRCRLIDLAASLDRIERDGAPTVASDPRMELLCKGAAILSSPGTDRAQRMQILFSDPYIQGWHASFDSRR